MNSDLLATCNALGYLEDDTYYKEPDCLDTVKYLIKYLHHEDNNHDVRIQLGSGQIVQNDLLPLLRQYPDDETLCAALIRLLVNLTQPALLCFGNHVPKETEQYHNYLEILSHNQAYKEAFSSEETWKMLAQKVYDILEKDWEDRLPDDSVAVERILVLCRNLLHVPATSDDGMRTTDDISTHDRLLLAMHGAGIDSMVLYLASSKTEQQWCLHVGEIISLMLKEQNVDALVGLNNALERERLGDELKDLRSQEEKRNRLRKQLQSSRHSRFGGTYIARGKAALADNHELVLHKSLQKCDNVTYDEGKSKLRKAKNRRPLVDTSVKRRSTLAVRKVLKQFCVGLLENGYNHLMYSVKDRLSRESKEEHDETYYFSIMNFLMEFNRKNKFHIDLVSETLQLSTLHFIDVSIMNCFELMTTDKQEGKNWGRRMHLALRCYKEFLMTLQAMQASTDPAVVESTKMMFNNIFYMAEYRDIFLTLLRKFEQNLQTQSFLDDLIQTTHLFIRLFENFCKGKSIIVQKKVKKRSNKPKKKRQPASESTSSSNILSEDDKVNCWSEIEENVTSILQGSEFPDPGPISDLFDPTSDVPEEEQQQKALVKVQKELHEKNVTKAVGLMRQARELWPEINIFGTADATLDENIATLKEICMADLTDFATEEQQALEQQEEEEEDEEEEERSERSSREVQFNLDDFLRKFAEYRVMQPYVKLLEKFESNSALTNHCIVKMFHRVGYDFKMYGLLFQASVFRCFQKIFRCARLNPALKELEQYGKFIVEKFFEILPGNPTLFAELLFWKQTVAEVYELKEGYGSFSTAGNSKRAVTWSEEEKQELDQLYGEFKESELDVVDCILAKITDESRTRRQIVHQLLIQGIVTDAVELKRKKGTKQVIWREEEEMELKRLYEEYHNSSDPMGNIMLMLTSKKSKLKVIEKLLSLGLAQDRKELHKRRKSVKPGKNKMHAEPMHVGGDDSDVEEQQERGREDSESDGEDDWTLLDLPSCLRKVSNDGFGEQVNWVKSSLEQALEDRENAPDDLQPVPLVPLTEEQEDSMQNLAFRKMLRFIGIQKPGSEQEMFWRIPPSLSALQLQDAVKVLSQPVKRKRDSPSKPESGIDKEEKEEEEDIESHPKRKRTMILDDEQNEENILTEPLNEEFERFSSESPKDPAITHRRQKRIAAFEESDDDESDGDSQSIKPNVLQEQKTPLFEEDVNADKENKDENINTGPISQSEVEDLNEEDDISYRKHKKRSVLDDDEDDE